MRKRTYEKEIYGDLFNVTDEEKDSLGSYTGLYYKRINSLLAADSGEYETLMGERWNFGNAVILTDEERKSQKEEILESVDFTFKHLPSIYSTILKEWEANGKAEYGSGLYRGTSEEEMLSMKVGSVINKPYSTAKVYEGSNSIAFALDNKNPVLADVKLENDVPYADIQNILEHHIAHEKEVVVSPFCRVKSVNQTGGWMSGDKLLESYSVELEAPKLELMSDEECNKLKAQILSQAPEIADLIVEKIQERAIRENIEWQIEGARKELARLDRDRIDRKRDGKPFSEQEYQRYVEDCKSLRKCIDSQYERADELTKVSMENASKIKAWKENIVKVCMSECRKKEIDMENKMLEIETKHKEMLDAQEHTKRKLNRENNINTTKKAIDIVESYDTKRILDSSKKMEQSMKNIGVMYYSKMPEYAETINRMKVAAVNGAKFLSNDENDYDKKFEDSIYELGVVTDGLKNGMFEQEINRGIAREENLLKGTVYNKFMKLVVEKEKETLSKRAEVLQEKANRRGLAALFRGASKAEKRELDSINQYLASIPDIPDDIALDKQNSARQIVADMQFYQELHQNDKDYEDILKKVDNMRSVLEEHFEIPQEDVHNIKSKMQEESKGKIPSSYMIDQMLTQTNQMPVYEAEKPNYGLSRIYWAYKDINRNIDRLEKNREERENNHETSRNTEFNAVEK